MARAPIAHDRVPECMSLFDVGCFPSKVGEGFPLTVLELLACGVPVVASHVADLLKVIRDGETGFVVPTDSPGEFAQRLHVALAAAAGMKAACVAVARGYSADRISESIFRELAAA